MIILGASKLIEKRGESEGLLWLGQRLLTPYSELAADFDSTAKKRRASFPSTILYHFYSNLNGRDHLAFSIRLAG
jgi:hypothetical protein